MGSPQGVKGGLPQKAQGLGEALEEDVQRENFHFLRGEERGSSSGGPDGGRQIGHWEGVPHQLPPIPRGGKPTWRKEDETFAFRAWRVKLP